MEIFEFLLSIILLNALFFGAIFTGRWIAQKMRLLEKATKYDNF